MARYLCSTFSVALLESLLVRLFFSHPSILNKILERGEGNRRLQ